MAQKLITLTGLAEFKNKLPAFIEGEGFIKNTVNDLVNYYLKTETYNKTEVDNIIAAIKSFTYEVVDELPTPSANTMNKIYLVKGAESGQTGEDYYAEYITIDKGKGVTPRYAWEKIGDTRIDLSNYYTKAQADAAIAAAIAPFKTEAQIKAIVEAYNYVTQTELSDGLALKQDEITDTNKLGADLVDDTNAEHKFVSTEEKAAWNAKYDKPASGIPATDLTQEVQDTLDKVDTIEEGAQKNVIEGVKVDVDDTDLEIVNKKAIIVTATNAEIDSLFE